MNRGGVDIGIERFLLGSFIPIQNIIDRIEPVLGRVDLAHGRDRVSTRRNQHGIARVQLNSIPTVERRRTRGTTVGVHCDLQCFGIR